MTRTPLAIANWKMNTDLEQAEALAKAAAAYGTKASSSVEIVLCPPFPWLVPLSNLLTGSQVTFGAQDCSPEEHGAFTGDVSAAMLAPWCGTVIVGHSERRQIHEEMDDVISRKLRSALEHGLRPVLCIGETLPQRTAGNAKTIVSRQLDAGLTGLDAEEIARCVVAYEPVWAIGTGKSATAKDAQDMCGHIRGLLTKHESGLGDTMRILYGGSVDADNAAQLIAGPDIDGALVGSASLDAERFARICDAISEK